MYALFSAFRGAFEFHGAREAMLSSMHCEPRYRHAVLCEGKFRVRHFENYKVAGPV